MTCRELVGALFNAGPPGAGLRRCIALTCTICLAAIVQVGSASAQTATVSVLHSFDGSDGGVPKRSFTKASDGNYYTVVDGTACDGCGFADTLVKVTPAGDFSVLHKFDDGNFSVAEEGFHPEVVIQADDGNLYGVCSERGANNGGTFWKVGLDGIFTKLFDFDGTDPSAPSGPVALVQGSDKNFYGVTAAGGSQQDGTFFRITKAGQLTKLADFTNPSAAGEAPHAQLVVGKDGNFYGLTDAGGPNGSTASGAIFKATQDGTVIGLHAFVDGEASGNLMPLVQASDGTFYGVSQQGGDGSEGSIYRYDPVTGVFTLLYSFRDQTSDGEAPATTLTEVRSGTFIGTALNGAPAQPNQLGGGSGSYFAISSSGSFTTIATTPGDNNGPRGPIAGLVPLGSNTYLGVTIRGGASDAGTVVKLTVSLPGPTPTPTPSATATPSPTASPTPTPAPQLLNISTRMEVLTGSNVLIGGFIITGSDQKKVLVRGLGPSLPVTGKLGDPTLELHDGTGSTIFSDNDWKDSQESLIEATGVPPTNDLEAAIVANLTANNSAYTAILAGNGAGTGIGLVEVYDLAANVNSKLANISTRGFVDTGDNVMIGGLILGGNGTAARVLVRAIGPSLTRAGVANALQDPMLELHDGNGNTVATNDDWKTSDTGGSQQSQIEATTVAPTDDRESALVRTLTAGNYTAIVRGKNNSTGVALVELYNLP